MQTKNFRNSGYERKSRDFYPTPDCYTDWLIEAAGYLFSKDLPVLEPAAGERHMANRLEALGFTTACFDIKPYKDVFEHDFLDDVSPRGYAQIVTNPPYGRVAEPFVRRALNVVREEKGIVAMLLPFDWDAAGERSDLFDSQGPFLMKIAINKRVKWIEGSEGSGMHNYAWYVWDWSSCGETPIIEYMPKRKTFDHG